MSRRPLIIVNPASAGGSTSRVWPALAASLHDILGAFDCMFTSSQGNATDLAREQALAGREFIIACGGDGTVSEVASGIIESGRDCELGLLHRGTGGDFRKTINLPAKVTDAARAIASGVTRTIDAGELLYTNRDGKQERRYFINVASFGMGGEVASRANASYKALGSTTAFAMATLSTTLFYKMPEVIFQIDDSEEFRCRITNVSIANGRYFGGGMKISPRSKLDDALFEVIVVKALTKMEIFTNVPRLYAGTHLDLPYVSYRSGHIIKARPADGSAVHVEADGEVPGYLPATFKVIPSAIRLRVPKDLAD